MNSLTKLFKPGVPRLVHLFAAPFLWTAIGCLLIYRGWSWVGQGHRLFFVPAALMLGTVKSLLILDATARRSINRIIRFKDGTCLGAVYSWKTWLLVLLMMTAGVVMRKLTQPGPIIGSLYMAIGWGLCFSSRLGWLHWWQLLKNDEIT